MEEELKSEPTPDHGIYLLFFRETRKGKRYRTLFNLAQGRPQDSNVWHMPDSIYWPTRQGWLLTIHRHDKHCYLLDPITLARKRLPWLDWEYEEHSGACFLSSSPTDPGCTVLCTNLVEQCLFFCLPGEDRWIRYVYNLGKNPITNIAACNGKFYGLTLYDNFSEIVCPPEPRINILEAVVLERPVAVADITQHLVESGGGLYVVNQYHKSGHSYKTVHISIKKREASNGEWIWVGVDRIGGRAFLLGNLDSSASCPANESCGINGDCVYFFQAEDNHVYCFDIVGGFISVHLPWSNISSDSNPFWVVPTLSV